MKLTRRGGVLLAAVMFAVVSGAFFGARGLNAIAAPGVVVLLAGVVQVWRYERPTIERELPDNGERGDHIPVRLQLTTATPFSASIRDIVGEGLSAVGADRQLSIDDTTLQYELRLESRGERRIGPLIIEATDILGLVSTTFRYEARDMILVRPRVRLLAGPARDDLVHLFGAAGDDRGQFDRLREYEPGDPLRDIHWKTSAKQAAADFVVKEFTADEGTETVEVVAEATAGEGDPMADATASIIVDLLGSSVNIGLTTPSGRIDSGSGPEQRERILDHLARADAGRVDPSVRMAAGIVVRADGGEPRIEMEGRRCTFADLAGERLAESPPRSAGEVAIGPVEATAT